MVRRSLLVLAGAALALAAGIAQAGAIKGEFGCVSDSAMGAGPVLAYGESIRKGRFVCTSEEAGVRCVNRRNGHGFFVSRQRVRLF